MPGATWQCATDGKCAFLPRRTLEIGVVHADEYDARLALRCNQFDDFRRNRGVSAVQSQTDYQYFRNA